MGALATKIIKEEKPDNTGVKLCTYILQSEKPASVLCCTNFFSSDLSSCRQAQPDTPRTKGSQRGREKT
jgi:hypothetical protein